MAGLATCSSKRAENCSSTRLPNASLQVQSAIFHGVPGELLVRMRCTLLIAPASEFLAMPLQVQDELLRNVPEDMLTTMRCKLLLNPAPECLEPPLQVQDVIFCSVPGVLSMRRESAEQVATPPAPRVHQHRRGVAPCRRDRPRKPHRP